VLMATCPVGGCLLACRFAGEVQGPADDLNLILCQVASQALIGTMDIYQRLQLTTPDTTAGTQVSVCILSTTVLS